MPTLYYPGMEFELPEERPETVDKGKGGSVKCR